MPLARLLYCFADHLFFFWPVVACLFQTALDIILKAPATTILLCKPVQAGIHVSSNNMKERSVFGSDWWVTRSNGN